MRIKCIATILVFVVSAAICFGCTYCIHTAVSQTEFLANTALMRFDEGDMPGALEMLSRMAERWNRQLPLMQMIASHDDLHDISLQYQEAATNLKSGDSDEFQRSMSLLQEALKHLRDQESLSFANLL